MRKRFLSGVVVSVSMLGMAGLHGVHAQAAAEPASEPAGKRCEIHIFSNSKYSGQDGLTMMLGGQGLLGAALAEGVHKDSNARRGLSAKDLLTTEFYAAEFSNLDVPFNGASVKSVAETIDSGEAADKLAKSKTRNSASTADCYFEVYVRSVQINQNPFFGSRLMTDALVKDFRKATPDRSGVVSEAKIERHFPPKDGEDVAASDEAFLVAARTSFIEKIKGKITR